MAINFEKKISNLVEAQFPGFYREEGEMFMTFVKAYYEWMEQEGNILNQARSLSQYRDIDSTVDDFILRFKNKYLPNIQFNIATNKQLFIKNALDFYRAKGTPRAVDLFFKLVYGLEARVYYPADDLFKLSDNTWQDERYLEIIPNPQNLNFVGQQVFGSISGASAFCERLVRVKKESQYIEVLYLSGLNGDFQTMENVVTRNLDDNIMARINGSLTSFEILTSTGGFELGEQVYVSDGTGKKAKAFVKQTTDYVGIVEFTLLDGGWGYTPNAQIIGSERSFVLDDVTFENTDFFYHTDPERQFAHFQQDLALLDIDTTDANTAAAAFSLDINTTVYAYTDDDPVTNPTPIFEGKIVEVNDLTNNLKINYNEVDYLDANGNYTVDLFGNTITSFWTGSNGGFGADGIEIPIDAANNATAITDIKAQANIIAWGEIFTIKYSSDDTLQTNDIIYQEEDIVGQKYFYGSVANTFTIVEEGVQQKYANIKRTVGFPRTNRTTYRGFDGDRIAVTIDNLSNLEVGTIGYGTSPDLQSQQYFADFGRVYGSNTGFIAERNDSFSYTDAAIFQIDTFEQIQSLTPWVSGEALSTELNQLIQGASSSANLTVAIDYVNENGLGSVDFANTTLDDALSINTAAAAEIGTIQAIVATAQGREYSRDPFFVVYEPDMYHFERYDFYIKYKLEDEVKSFRLGEDIITLNGNKKSRARIFFHNPTTGEIKARRILVSSDLDTNYLTNITGNSGNGTITVTSGEVHTMDTGDTVNITGTTNFNYTGQTVTRIDPFTFTFAAVNVNEDETSGTISGSYFNAHIYTDDDFRHGDRITGVQSDVSADIEVVDELRMSDRTGLNADVLADAYSGSGFATEIEVLNSGFGYFGKRYVTGVLTEGETLNLISAESNDRTIQAYGFLGKQGIAPGSHPNRKSFLSEDKVLADNNFYQEYSYQVLTALPFDKYRQTLIDVLHVAGTQAFGGYVGTSRENVNISTNTDTSTFIIKQYPMFINEQTFFAPTVS